MTPTSIDWFSGIGGGTLSMRAAGWDVVGACERDERKLDLYLLRAATRSCEVTHGDVFTWHPPAADLWYASADVATLHRWVNECVLPANPRPRWVWMDTVREDVSGLLFDSGVVIDIGRRHIIVGPAVDLSEPPPNPGYPNPGRYRTVEDAEAAQGFPRGYTDCCQLDPHTRRNYLGASVNVTVNTWIATRIATAAMQCGHSLDTAANS